MPFTNNNPMENTESEEVQNNAPEKQRVEAPEPIKASPAPQGQTQNSQPADLSALSQPAPQPQQSQQPPNNGAITQPAVPAGKGSEPYIKAAENVMQKDKHDPYQEEEDHEDVQIQYLHDRFGKDIKKGE